MRDDRDSSKDGGGVPFTNCRNKDQEKTLLLLGSRLQLQVQDVFYLFLPIFSNKMKNELQSTTHLSRHVKIPSEMEVAPRYSCLHC